jgi:hypothetical protein
MSMRGSPDWNLLRAIRRQSQIETRIWRGLVSTKCCVHFKTCGLGRQLRTAQSSWICLLAKISEHGWFHLLFMLALNQFQVITYLSVMLTLAILIDAAVRAS